MEDHLNQLMLRLVSIKNENKDLFSGVWWSNHGENPLLISFKEINQIRGVKNLEIQNSEESFMSINDFVHYIWERKQVEDKNIKKLYRRHEDLKVLLDDFEKKIGEIVQLSKETMLKGVSLDLPDLYYCNNYIKEYCAGNYKSDEKLIKHTKELIKNIINTSAIDINKFNEKIDKATDIVEKVTHIKKMLESVQNYFIDSTKMIFKLKIKQKSKNGIILKEKFSGIFEKSQIVKENELEMVNEWIKEQLGEFKTFELIFNSKDEGFSGVEFHKKCDKKGPTIIFVITATGKRLGGYANMPWHKGGHYQYDYDEKCFLFSLDLKEKYNHKPGLQYSIYGSSGDGPAFGGGHDLYLADNCNINNNSYCKPNNTYNTRSRTCNDIAGARNFKVQSDEVYLIK